MNTTSLTRLVKSRKSVDKILKPRNLKRHSCGFLHSVAPHRNVGPRRVWYVLEACSLLFPICHTVRISLHHTEKFWVIKMYPILE
jgi:hypothetical protein